MSSSPPGVRAAWILGFAGLLPFFGTAAVMWAGPRRLEPALFFISPILLLAYAATIASFLGGVRWGVEAARPGGPRAVFLLSSVAPQLAAVALIVAPLETAWRYAGLAVVLVVQGVGDVLAPDLPDWYRRLRIPLTVGAAASVVAGLVWVLLRGATPGR